MRLVREKRLALRLVAVVTACWMLGGLADVSFSLTKGQAGPSADVRAALERISAASMRGHLSFIASDLLEGRATPSRGLDIAADYIAAQFRRAGLEPVGDDGYFQTAKWTAQERTFDGFEMELTALGRTTRVGPEQVSLVSGGGGFPAWSVENELRIDSGVIKLDSAALRPLDAVPDGTLKGHAVMLSLPATPAEQRQIVSKLARHDPSVVVFVDRSSRTGNGLGAGRLIDPDNPRTRQGGQGQSPPTLCVYSNRVADLLRDIGLNDTVSLHLRVPPKVERPTPVRNVIGLLRGSDPALKDTCVIVSAHYDHIGMRSGEGDVIFNGANDDGSGTVSVVEIASALATMKERPKRSVLFMTYFGEERGGLGSRYYGTHPVFPLEKTVAMVNLEQMGRTDDTEGPRVAACNMTGFDYSDVGTIFEAAGKETGIRVYKHPQNSDAFFNRSDNATLAELGVPAHTLSVAYVYPDYHGVGDHWEKIDYENMAKVDRMVAVGVLKIANSTQEPRWNEVNPKAAGYVKAWKERKR